MTRLLTRLEKKLERLARSSPALERLARAVHARALLHAVCSHRQEMILGRRLAGAPPVRADARAGEFSLRERGEVDDVRGFFLAANPGQVGSLMGLYDYGCHVLFLFVAGRPSGYLWYVDAHQARPLPELAQFAIALAGKDVYGFNFYVAPAARGSQQATKLLAMALERLAGRGYEQAYGCVERGNIPARWLYASTGWSPLREVAVWTFLSGLRLAGGRWFVNPKLLRLWPGCSSVPAFDYIPLGSGRRSGVDPLRLSTR